MDKETSFSCINGPDQVLPANDYKTINIESCVKLRMPENGLTIERVAPLSVPGLLGKIATKYPDQPALCAKNEDGTWKKITYKNYEKSVRTCAKAFLKLGLERHHAVCILGFNSPEWFISDLAAIYAGGVATGIYTTNTPDACLHCAEISKANIIVVEDDKQLQKILQIRSQLSHLKAIIQYTGMPKEEGVLTWAQVVDIGNQESDDKLNDVLKTIAINECCTLVFTSGTVGPPKAAMLSHDNLIWDAVTIQERINLTETSERLISYLPLSHVAAQAVDIYLMIYTGSTVYFADKDALRGSLIKSLLDVQPTRFLGVPRVWEKIYEKMMEIASQSGAFKATLSSWAKRNGLQHYLDQMSGKDTYTWSYAIASYFIFNKIKQALGLNCCKSFVTAAAPMSSDIKKYFMSIDIPIMDAFGMSETAGAHTLSTRNSFNFESIGQALLGSYIKIENPDEAGNGELCMNGRNIFMGYLNDHDKTIEALDQEGWLHSGDLGYKDKRGLVYITGRLKEIIITAGGENIAPVPIEHKLLNFLPQISNAILIGDRRKFVAVLLTLKTEVSEDGIPKSILTEDVKDLLKKIGCPANTVQEVLAAGPHENFIEHIQTGINNTNELSISNAQRIQKFAVLPIDFSIPTGEFGPTMKLKRSFILNKYSHIVDKLYE